MLHSLVSLIGRAMMAAIFLRGGFEKAMASTATIAQFSKLGLPNPPLAYGVTVGVELLGGLAVLIGWKTRFAAPILAIWCLATAYVAHSNIADHAQLIHLMKNICMAGGFLQLYLLGPGKISIDRR